VAGTGLTPAAQTINSTNAGAGTLSWTATVFAGGTTGAANWLSISAPNRDGPLACQCERFDAGADGWDLPRSDPLPGGERYG